MSRANQYYRREKRREQAIERQETRDKLGDAGQIKRLKSRGFGHCKEVVRLEEKVNAINKKNT